MKRWSRGGICVDVQEPVLWLTRGKHTGGFLNSHQKWTRTDLVSKLFFFIAANCIFPCFYSDRPPQKGNSSGTHRVCPHCWQSASESFIVRIIPHPHVAERYVSHLSGKTRGSLMVQADSPTSQIVVLSFQSPPTVCSFQSLTHTKCSQSEVVCHGCITDMLCINLFWG